VSCLGGTGDFAVGQGIEIPLAGPAPTFTPWGVAKIIYYSRSGNVATLQYSGPTFGAKQTIRVEGLADSSFNGAFTVTGNDGDFGHISMVNSGPNASGTSGSGTATLTSAQVVVTSQGILNGAKRYAYRVVLRGYHGELSVASNAGTTTTGAAMLGVNSVKLSSCSRSDGIVTCTASSRHNFQSNVPVNVYGMTGPAASFYNGAHFIVSTPTSTTFTFYQLGQANDSGNTAGGSAQVVAKNVVRWNMNAYANLQSIVYRSVNGGAYSLAGVTQGMDGSFVDQGFGPPAVPAYIPSAPPRVPRNGILAATITAIERKTLTLSVAATATVAAQTAQHDNTPIVFAACAAMPADRGGTILIPAMISGQPEFNSPLDLRNCAPDQVEIRVGSALRVNEPIIMKRKYSFKGILGARGPTAQFTAGRSAAIDGSAYPFFYWVPGNFGPTNIENLDMNCNAPYQSCILTDQDSGGGGVVNVRLEEDNFQSGGSSSMPVILRSGGFHFWFNRDYCQVVPHGWGAPNCLEVNLPNSLGNQTNLIDLAGIMTIDTMTFAGTGIEFNDYGQATGFVPGYYTFKDILIESPITPLLTLSLSSAVTNLTLRNAIYADFTGGPATPMIQVSNSKLMGARVEFPSCANSHQPLFEGTLTGVKISGGFGDDCSLMGIRAGVKENYQGSGSYTQYIGQPLQFSSNAYAYYAMDTPAAPLEAVVSAGGSVPIGINYFGVSAFDSNGGETITGSLISATTSAGNQTVTITRPTLPGNAVAWKVYWQGPGAPTANPLNCSPLSIVITKYVHAATGGCGNPFNFYTTAGKSSMGPAGVSAFRLVGNSFATTENCSSGGSPASCEAAAAGAVAIPPGANPTLTVNTSQVTEHSQIFLEIDESLIISGVTCNTKLSELVQPVVTARKPGSSFTIQMNTKLFSNPACVSYHIVN
jgi:hypothetical protein